MLRAPSRNSVARNGISCARSKPYAAAAAKSCSSVAADPATTRSSAPGAAATTDAAAATSSSSVRRLSCRPSRSSAPLRAPPHRARPARRTHRNVVIRARPLQLVEEPEAGLRKRKRQLAGRSAAPPAAAGPLWAGCASAAPVRRAPACRRCPDRQLAPEPARICAASRVAISEWPPRWKKLSASPARSSPRSPHQIAQQHLLRRGRRHISGRQPAPPAPAAPAVQLAVRRQRQDPSTTYADGTMYSGSGASAARHAAGDPRDPSRGTT